MRRLISVLLCAVMLFCTVTVMPSCSKPPEFSEIEGRLRELIEASHEINTIFFGEGLPVYEHVMDPKSSMDVIIDKDNGTRTYYYEINDKEYGRVIAYRSSYADPYIYAQVLREPDSSRTPVYENSSKKAYAYALEGYVEPHYDFYYSDSDPENYDYVTVDSPYKSIGAIKEAAEKVYSRDYLASLYESIFDGTVVQNDTVLVSSTARYMEYSDEDGTVTLMMSNTYKPIISERLSYDLSTAEIVRPKRKDFVTISVQAFYESRPEERFEVKLSMILQDGVWLLDSATI